MFASARKRSSAGGSTTLAGAASARQVIAIDDDTQTADATTQTSSSASTILVATGESRVAPTASAPPAKKRKLTAAAAADQLLASSPAPLVNSLPTLSRAMTFFSSPYWSYSPVAVGGAAATRYYEALRSMVDPEPGTIFLYGKYHKENRLTKCFARHAGGFAYSGTVKSASGEWPAEIEELYQIAVRDQAFDTTRLPTDFQQRVKDASARRTADVDASSVAASSASASSAAFAASAPVYWDTVLINYYRDGSDSISWHSDKDSKHFPIASFSFGAEREFQIRERPSPGGSKSTKQLATYSHILAHGSLLLMWPGMQERYHHSVPKRKGIANGRVNVTFRLHHRADATTAITAKA